MANTKITTAVIKDDAITTAKIADDAVTGALIADDVALAGNPTTTTQSAGNNTTRIATTAFVTTAINNLVDSAPAALDTLNELAAALGDDANFSTTVTNSIATKAALAGATFTGNVTVDERLIVTGNTNSYSTAPLVYFDSTSTANAGVRDWAIGPADDSYGNFHIFVGASTGADPVGNAGRVLTITNTGNVSLTGSGNTALSINTGNNSGDNSQIKFGDTNDADAGQINYDHGTNAMQFRTNGGSNALVLDSSGNTIVTGPNSTTMEVRAPTDNAFISIYGGYNDSGAEEAGIILGQNTTAKWQIANTTTNQFRIYNYAQSQSAFTISSGGIAALGNASHGDDVLYLTRSDDGNILRFFKGSTDLGAINTNAGALLLKGASTTAPVQLQTHDGNEDIEVDPDGFIKFETAGSERLRIDSDGIKFHGDTAAANGLNDYEEGVYGTSFNCSVSGSITLNGAYNNMQYTKVGRLVTVTGYFIVSSVSSPNGVLQITLPFQSVNTSSNSSSVDLSFNVLSTGSLTDAWGIIDHNSNTINVYVGSGTSVSTSFANRIVSGTDLRLTATYIAA